MITLESLWRKYKGKKGLKVRYVDWNHKIKYFEIDGYCDKEEKITGKLDSGEKVSYCKNGLHWILYFDGSEDSPKAA